MTGRYKDSPRDFEAVDVPGDGNCFYYALSRTLPEAKDFKYRWNEKKVNEFKQGLLRDMGRLIKENDSNSFFLSGAIDRGELTQHLRTDKDYAQQPAIILSAWQLQRCIVVFSKGTKYGGWYVQVHGPTGKNCDRYQKNWERCKNCSFLLYEGVGKSEGLPEGTGHYLALKPLRASGEPPRSSSHEGDKEKKRSDTEKRSTKEERRKKDDQADRSEEARARARASPSTLLTSSIRERSSERHLPRKQPLPAYENVAPRLLGLAQRILDLAKRYLDEENVPEAKIVYAKIEKELKSLLRSQAALL